MNNYAAHVWTIIITIIIFILALLVWMFSFWNLQDTLASDNLQDAVRTCAYLSQDKADRAERGSFVINKGKFANLLGQTHIREFGNTTLGKGSENYQIYYIPDNAKADAADSGQGALIGSHAVRRKLNPAGKDNSQNDHNVSHGYKYEKGTDESAPWMAKHDTVSTKDSQGNVSDSDTGKYEAVRGIRVVVNHHFIHRLGNGKNAGLINNYNNHRFASNEFKNSKYYTDDVANENSQYHRTDPNDLSTLGKYETFTATDIVQTYGKNALNDTYNDISR